jgi:hypothetical protein
MESEPSRLARKLGFSEVGQEPVHDDAGGVIGIAGGSGRVGRRVKAPEGSCDAQLRAADLEPARDRHHR